jgi:drug/metabolite transporter (DMT)-like permease
MNFPLLLALITFVGWGTGDLFTILAAKRIGANLTVFWVFVSSFLLSLLLLPFAPHDLSGITLPLLALNIFLGFLFVLGNVCICEAFRTSSAPLVGIIVQSYPSVILLLSALIYKDKISAQQFVFITIIFFRCSAV